VIEQGFTVAHTRHAEYRWVKESVKATERRVALAESIDLCYAAATVLIHPREGTTPECQRELSLS
jgi:hypothetical protein